MIISMEIEIRKEQQAGMTPREAAAYMGCSYDTMAWYITEGKVESYPIGETGKHRRVTRAACEALRRKLQSELGEESPDQDSSGTEAMHGTISTMPTKAFLNSLEGKPSTPPKGKQVKMR